MTQDDRRALGVCFGALVLLCFGYYKYEAWRYARSTQTEMTPQARDDCQFSFAVCSTMNMVNRESASSAKTYNYAVDCMHGNKAACKDGEAWDAQETRRMNRTMGLLGAATAGDEIRGSVGRSERSLADSNQRSWDRQQATGYYDYANQSRQNGNSSAAQNWQSQGDVHQRRALGY